jgi:hypothetical protein
VNRRPCAGGFYTCGKGKKGFISFLEFYLRNFGGIPSVEMTNISIPGTMSMFGLSNFLKGPLADDYDHILVEYAINDYDLFKKRPALWQSAFAVLLTEVHNRYPSRPKTVVILGRRDWKYRAIQSGIHQAMRDLAAQHGFDVFDVDTLMQSPPFEGQVFRDLYFDGAHYKPPMVTNYISTVCALHLITRRHAEASAAPRIPNPGCALKYVDFTEDIEAPGSIEEFRSERYFARSRQLEARHILDFEVPGLPCGLSFVAARDVSSVLLDVDGQKSIIHMLHRECPPYGKCKFLIRHIPFYWIDYASPRESIPDRSRIRIRAIDRADQEWDEGIVRESFAMVPAPARTNPNARMCLLRLDYLSRDA